MKARLTNPRILIAILVTITLAAGLIVSVLVFATGGSRLTVTGYSDLVRFQADGVATLQVQIYDLSGKVVWDSSVVSGDIVDWDRRNDTGERLAYGAYIYSAQGWNASGDLILQKKGKLALMPGDKVQLQAAPAVPSSGGQQSALPVLDGTSTLHPMAVDFDHSTESWAFGQVGIGTTNPDAALHINGSKLVIQSTLGSYGQIQIANPDAGEATVVQAAGVTGGYGGILTSSNSKYIWAFGPGSYGTTPDKFNIGNNYLGKPLLTIDATTGQVGIGTTNPDAALHIDGSKLVIQSTLGSYGQIQIANPDAGEATVVQAAGVTGGYGGILTSSNSKYIWAFGPGSYGTTPDKFNIGNNYLGKPLLTIDATTGQVGIGITNPSAALEVHGSATNLFALYDPVAPTDPKFRVMKTGEVHADGAYYGASYNTGSADVAERINTSEWVEKGDVVEIDPEHLGFFRKSSTPYSTKVAGIISTSPGVILGNKAAEEATDNWEDNRPVLAIAGRVPLQVTAENGAIEIGDLLVASSTPGVAMKGDPKEAMGAVVGKAMEPLKEGDGTIVVQVMLR